MSFTSSVVTAADIFPPGYYIPSINWRIKKKKNLYGFDFFYLWSTLFFGPMSTPSSINTHLSGDISLQRAAIHVRFSVSFGILEGAMCPHAQLHLGEYFATSHYLNLTISNNPNQVRHTVFGISNVCTISKNPDVKIQTGTAKPTSPPSCSLLVRESTEPVGEENRFPQ